MEQTGIGGDDKVGIYVALQMLREHANIKAFFPSDEEIGCVGSSMAEPTFFDNVTIALQCDRRGNTDFITKASGTELSSKAFQADVLPIIKQYGYKFEHGMMTDVMELKQMGIGCSMANMSCGYYNPHSDNEYVDVNDVHKVTMMVHEIILKLGATSYPHIAPITRKDWWNDRDTASVERNWWDEPSSINDRPSYARLLEQTTFCQDCGMKPATGINNLCDDCWDWHKHISKEAPKRYVLDPTTKPVTDFSKKPDYKPISSATFNFKGKRKGKKRKGW